MFLKNSFFSLLLSIAPSPGKLIRYVVEDGEHLDANQPFAEMEVMKMYLPLVVSEAGTVRFINQPGSVLEPGDLIAILTLDDPSRVKHAIPYDGQLPKVEQNTVDERAHNKFKQAKRNLELILQGYDAQSKMLDSLKVLLETLKNPELPYLELQV